MGTPSYTTLVEEVEEAGKLIAPLWPLSGAVAMNPLVGLVDLDFDAAVAEARRWFSQWRDASSGAPMSPRIEASLQRGDQLAGSEPSSGTPLACVEAGSTISGRYLAFDRDIARWCLAVVSQPGGSGVDDSLVARWRHNVMRDRTTRRLLGAQAPGRIDRLSLDPTLIFGELIACLGDVGDRVPLFRALLARLPGWAGHAQWQRLHPQFVSNYGPLALVDLVSLQLLYRVVTDTLTLDRVDAEHVRHVTGPRGETTSLTHELVSNAEIAPEALSRRLRHVEDRFRTKLLADIEAGAMRVNEPHDNKPYGTEASVNAASGVDVQFVFCMDPRSDRLRRRLEEHRGYATDAVAGFFGVPLRIRASDGSVVYDLAPPLVAPVLDLPLDHARLAIDSQPWSLGDAVKGVKEVGVAPYLGAEVGGVLAGFDALVRTVGSFVPIRRGSQARMLDAEEGGLRRYLASVGIDALEGVIEPLGAMLATLGPASGLAPLVVFVGHRARSRNNAYAASLQCGACGGAPGTLNALVAASLLNMEVVRERLERNGISIPTSTRFLAGEHNTTTDELVVIGAQKALSTEPVVESIEEVLATINHHVATRRGRRRANDWSEVRPEMGLIHNAALVIGDRSLTRTVDLDGRVFLHSYRRHSDPDGSQLAGIFAGPLVVAHWINQCYLFSSLAPEVFGAGDKTLHNLVGRFGVLEGLGWDLKIGLPEQSVVDADGVRHEPLRLTAVIDQSPELIDRVLRDDRLVTQLVEGDWLTIVGRSDSGAWMLRQLRGWVEAADSVEKV